MRKKDSWTSEFRKKRFYERQVSKKEKEYEKSFEAVTVNNTPKTIAIMLDLDGTSDNINDEKARVFFEQLEFIRKKFEADFGIISISTYYRGGKVMDDVLEVLERNLPETFKIGLNFFYGGTYSYPDKIEIFRHPEFNSNKIKTFIGYYDASSAFNRWMAIIDDGIDEDAYKEYQDRKTMFFCRPSQSEDSLANNNFMSISSTNKGFDGVLDGLSQYIENIADLTPEQIRIKQKQMITHLSSSELISKIRKGDYYFLKRYFSEGYADSDDYSDALRWLLRVDPEEIYDEMLEVMLEVVEIVLKGNDVDDREAILKKIKEKKK